MCKHVTILLSTYNGELFLDEQIDSLLNQTYDDWELLIRDDGSTDNTISIIKYYADDNPKITFINENNIQNIGVVSSFIELLHYKNSDFYMFCDQDDFWKNHKIETVVNEALNCEKEEPLLIYTDLEVVDNELNQISCSMLNGKAFDKFNNLLVENTITGCTVLINQSLKSKVLKKDSEIDKLIMHDWWLGLIASAFGTVVSMDEPTILYRQHGNNAVGALSIGNKIRRFFQLKNNLNRVNKSFKQAEHLYSLYSKEMPTDKLRILEEYLLLQNTSILNKYSLMKKNDFKKNGLIKNIYFILIVCFFVNSKAS